jgi:hypothetical protein
MGTEELVRVLKQNPLRVLLAVLVIVFWIAGPFIAQKFFDISAIKVSFAIIVLYFVAWKFYENF